MQHISPPWRLPPEWTPQSGVMLAWPHAHSDWSHFLAVAERVYEDIARAVCAHEKLLVVCYDAAHRDHIARRLLHQVPAGNLQLVIVPSNDTWVRDYGPITVLATDGEPQLLNFRFNAWGNKFRFTLDDAVNRHLDGQRIFSAAMQDIELVLEGGSIDTNGIGDLLTTTTCLLSKQRNPHLDQRQITEQLQHLLGIPNILWLTQGHVEGDDTDAHIDTLARFTAGDTIAHVSCTDRNDIHYSGMQAMTQELAAMRNSNGDKFRLVPLPIPAPIYHNGRRLPATHANFLIINDAVLVPVYNDPTDSIALENLAACFPDRQIVAIDCLPLIRQSGSLHCITMQLPQGVIS